MTHEESGAQFAAAQHQKTVELQAIAIKAKDDEIARLGIVVADQRATIAGMVAPAAPSEQAEPHKFDDYPEFRQQAMGCGLEDRGITDRYEAMRYGWDEAVESVAERINLFLSDFAAPAAPLPDQPGLSLPELCEQFQAAAALGADYVLPPDSARKLFEAMTTPGAAPLPELTGPSEAQWISVDVQLPEAEMSVLVMAPEWERPCIAAHFPGDEMNRAEWQDDFGQEVEPTPTAWQPLPEIIAPASRMGGITSKESAETAAPVQGCDSCLHTYCLSNEVCRDCGHVAELQGLKGGKRPGASTEDGQ